MSDRGALVHYAGTWTDTERQRLERAIEAIENTDWLASPHFGAPWICIHQHVETRDFYVATRSQWPHVLITATVQELASRIRALPTTASTQDEHPTSRPENPPLSSISTREPDMQDVAHAVES